jgi:hypothetical protein
VAPNGNVLTVNGKDGLFVDDGTNTLNMFF